MKLEHRWRDAVKAVVVTYNAGNASDAKVEADLDRLLEEEQAQVVLLQEVADRNKVLTRWAKRHDWVLHQETNNDKGHVAVLVAPGLKITDRGYYQCTNRTPVGAWGAGPSTIAAKWIAWVELEADGRTVVVASTHFVPSVQRPARGRKAIAARARRIALYARHVTALIRWRLSRPGAKIIGADWNATIGFKLLGRLRRLVLRTAASHGHRAIDMLRSTIRSWIKAGKAEALDGYSSDHRPVRVIYLIRRKR